MVDTVVVTGGSGFIGSHLISELRHQRLKIINIDKVPPQHLENDVHFQHADLSDKDFKYIGEKPSVVFHLAADTNLITKGKTWFDDSHSSFFNNSVSTFNVLKEINPEIIIFSSTANLYGEGRKLKELSPFNISSQYGYSKLIAEQIIRSSLTQYRILRFGTVVGPRAKTYPARLVYCAMNDIETEVFCNGQNYRDLVDVRDIVDALIASVGFDEDYDRPRDTYNVSMGNEICGQALAEIVSELALDRGYELKYKLTPDRAPGYVKDSTLSIDRIREIQGWDPKIDVYSMISSIFDYYENTLDAPEPPSA